MLAKFRDQKSLAKKISKALGRNEVSDAGRLERNLTPRLKLDHVIKERYPTFVDALRDLDDALSLLFLFANLPSTVDVPPKVIARCQRLTLEFEHYLIRTHSLRKSFLSIKGIYYQVTIQGQDILWLVPYRFVQRHNPDVDFRIMATFVEFYTTLLSFINFRLYTGIGLVYPPRFDAKSEEQGAELGAFQLEGQATNGDAAAPDLVDAQMNGKAQAEADRLLSLPDAEQTPSAASAETQSNGTAQQDDDDANDDDGPSSTALDTFPKPQDASADALLQPSLTADSSRAGALFEPFTFFLSREAPRHPVEFILKAFGCKRVGWDTSTGEPGSYCDESDKRITHQIVDRPDIPLPSPPLTEPDDGDIGFDDGVDDTERRRTANERVPGRIYVQPQWVWDSINAGELQKPDLYAPGATLPPHLSPWVKPRKGDYDPMLPLVEQEMEGEAELAEGEDDEEASEGEEVDGVRGDDETREMEDALNADGGVEVAQDEGMDVVLGASDDDEDDAEGDDGEWGGLSGDEGETLDPSTEAQAAREHQAELEAEALGTKVVGGVKVDPKAASRAAVLAKRTKEEKDAAEDVERRKMMMPRRKRKMYEKMVYSNARKDEEAEKLRSKRRKFEKGGAKSSM